MSVIEVKVPDIGDFKDIPIIEVMVKAGDSVAAEDPLIALESDKATMEVPAPQAGTTVLPGTTVLQVEEPDGWHTWQEVDSSVVSRATDRYYVVDYTGGAVEFDGLRVPQLGERIRTLSYEFCAGTAGNVPASAMYGQNDCTPARRNPNAVTSAAAIKQTATMTLASPAG